MFAKITFFSKNNFGAIFTPDDKKYLGITSCSIRILNDQYVNYFGQRILVRDIPTYHQNELRLRDLYYHYTSHD